FGGNSNWRGPVWFPLNHLVIESLRRYQRYFGDSWTVELPTGSGVQATLGEVADELSRRLRSIFLPDPHAGGRRPVFAATRAFPPDWPDDPLFFEYFHGDTGAGLGASPQTGWTGLVADRRRSAALTPRSRGERGQGGLAARASHRIGAFPGTRRVPG